MIDLRINKKLLFLWKSLTVSLCITFTPYMQKSGIILFLLSIRIFADFHPADTDQDFRITTAELSAAHDLLPNISSSDESLSDPSLAQAWFIWHAGETYQDRSSLNEPYRFLPDSSYVSLSERALLPLHQVEIIGLTGANGPVTGQFRPVHTTEWLTLDVDEQNGVFTFLAPYVPSPWLPSRDLEIEFTDGASTWKAGLLRLLPIDRSQTDLPTFLDHVADDFADLGNWDPDATVKNLAKGQTTSDFEKLMGYHYAYLRHAAQSFRLLKQSPPNPDTEIELFIAEELFTLYSLQSKITGIPRPETAAASRRTQKNSSDCVAINNWPDLVDYTFRRASLEEAEDDDSLAKKAKDKGLEQLTEAASKLGKRLASDSVALSKRAGLAVTIPIELYALLSEWDRKMLPKHFFKIDYTLLDHNFNPLNLPMAIDSHNRMGACPLAVFAQMKASIRSERFSMAKYLLENKVPEPDALKGLVEGGSGQLVSGVVDYYSDELGDARQKAIDKTHDEIKEFDYSPPACSWVGIPIPLNSESTTYISTRSQTGRFQGGENTFSSVDPVQPGSDIIELKINTTNETTFGRSNLPNTPAFFEKAPLESSIPQLEFRPAAHSVDDVEDPPKLTVNISTSYENHQLRWKIFDNTSKKIYEKVTTENTPLGSTSSTHTLEDYIVPTDPLKYPLVVWAQSMAQGCLEAGREPPITEQAILFYQAKVFDLDPTRICRDPGETIIITATPSRPDPDFKVETWEIIRGGGTVTPLTDTTATLVLPDEADAEIAVKATGQDGFVSQGYYATGPCLKFVQTSEIYTFDPSIISEGDLYSSRLFSFTASYGDFLPSDLATPFSIVGNEVDGTEIITGLGQVITSIDKEIADDAATTRSFETTTSGVGIALLDFDIPAPIVAIESAQISGNYFTSEQLAEDPKDHVWQPFFGKGNGEAIPEVISIGEDIYQIHFEYSLRRDDDVDETGLAISWLSNRGTILDTVALQPDPNDPESFLFSVTVEYPRTEKLPDLNFTASGNIVCFDDDGNETKSFHSSATFVYQKVDINLHSTVRIPLPLGSFFVCKPAGDIPRSAPFAIYNQCCGGISLRDYERVRGSARQRTQIASYIQNADLGPTTNLIRNFTDEEQLLFCEEQKKKREEEERKRYEMGK